MELKISADAAARIPPLGDFADIASNWTSNLTRIASEITNYSLNFMDVGAAPAPAAPSSTLASFGGHSPALAVGGVRASLLPLPTPTPTSAPTAMRLPTQLLEAAYAIMANNTTPTHDPAIEDDEIRLEHAPQLSKSALVKVYVLSVMALLSLLGNILTMWNIYKTRIARRSSRHSWSAIYSLIFHLSIADVLVTGFCIIGEAAWCYTVQWLADELTCKLVKLCQMFSLYLSTYVLVLIGVDRWIAVKYPMKSLNMAKRCYRLLGGTYILSFLLSLPQFFIFHVARGPFIEEFHQCVTHGFYTAEWQEQLYTTFTLIFTFLLPLCILFGTYLSTFRTISSSEKMFQGSKLAAYSSKPSAQTNRQRLIHKAKMKSLRISVVIIIAFLICWTPYNVMMIIFMFLNPDKRLSEDLHSAIFFFGMANSLVNPLIYGAFHLCPMKRKASKSGNNNAHSLNRGDSQRTPSMLTAVTQIDNNGRHIRTYRQPSYYRTHSNGSNYKEHVSLLQVTPNSSLMRKAASVRNPHPPVMATPHPHPHPRHHHHYHAHTHAANLFCNGSGASSTVGSPRPSTLVLSYDTHRESSGGGDGGSSSVVGGGAPGGAISLGKHSIGGAGGGGGGMMSVSLLERHGLIGADENVSSV